MNIKHFETLTKETTDKKEAEKIISDCFDFLLSLDYEQKNDKKTADFILAEIAAIRKLLSVIK